LQPLWKKASIKKGGRMLGTGEEQILSSSQLEINKEHLKVRGVFSRSRDVAARKSDIE
jgi:hypothetical protein